MKRIACVLSLFVFCITPALASEPVTPPATFAIGVRGAGPVIISPNKLPANISQMEPAEFAKWAAAQNQKAVEDSIKEHNHIKDQVGGNDVRHATITESSGSIKNRFGGGVGYGGFGGAGGYNGYTSPLSGGSGFGFNYGFGFNNQGNASQSTNTSRAKTFDMYYRDRTYYGRPALLVNPFCPPVKN